MTAMHSTWGTDLRHEGCHFPEQDQSERGFLSHVGERATSAPPPTGGENVSSPLFNFMSYHGPDDALWFRNSREDGRTSPSGRHIATQPQSRLGLERTPLDRSGHYSPTMKAAGQFFVGNDGRATAPGTYNASSLSESLLSPSVAGPPNSTSSQSFGFEKRFDIDLNRGDSPSLIRSQSAAPELARGINNIPPPPGMGDMRSRSGEPFLLDSPNDHTPVSIAGPRRPASTGVIGQQNSSALPSVMSSLGLMQENVGGGAVRPAPKTLMDLIQEDFPKSPSPVYNSEYSGHRSDQLDPPALSHNVGPNGYDNSQFQLSPCRHHVRDLSSEAHPSYPRYHTFSSEHEVRQNDVRSDGNELAQRVDRLQVSSGQPQTSVTPTNTQYMPAVHPSSPRALSQHPGVIPKKHAVHAPFYTNEDCDEKKHRVSHNRVLHQQPPQYDHITMFYSNRSGGGSAVAGSAMPGQILQSGHAIYLNPPAYGYATVQYHPSSPHHPPHVMHHPNQSATGSLSPHEFISLLPVQGVPRTQIPAMSNGTYTYWQQQDIASTTTGAPPAVAIVTAPAGAPPVALSRAGSAAITSPPNSRHGVNDASGVGARNLPEKGKNKRGSVQGHRRTGGSNDSHAKHSVGGVSSVVLDEFRGAKSRDWTVNDIKGHIVEFCQDQNGSRLIQQRLDIGDPKEQAIVMDEVLPSVRLLRNDVFGNYVVQKLLERGTTKMKALLRDTLGGEMLPLSLQMYGCRVVQKALETLDEDDLPCLLMEFRHNVLSCIHDQNGNHVIQKCIEVMSKRARKARNMGDEERAEYLIEQIDFVVEDVLDNVPALSCHPYGCRVLQRILEHCDGMKKSRALDEISRCHKMLLDDQYGNYVIQHVLQYGRHSDRESVLDIVVESGLLALSKQKFASNVVEKLLQHGTPEQRNVIVREMLKVADENDGHIEGAELSSVVLLMVRDAYANYVVQTTLDVVAEGEEKMLLLEELRSHSSELRNYAFAKHIATKLSN